MDITSPDVEDRVIRCALHIIRAARLRVTLTETFCKQLDDLISVIANVAATGTTRPLDMNEQVRNEELRELVVGLSVLQAKEVLTLRYALAAARFAIGRGRRGFAGSVNMMLELLSEAMQNAELCGIDLEDAIGELDLYRDEEQMLLRFLDAHLGLPQACEAILLCR